MSLSSNYLSNMRLRSARLSIGFGLLASSVIATSLGMMIVKMPIYVHASDGDAEIQITDVPFVTAGAVPESRYSAICHSFVPPHEMWNDPEDVNIASVYGIKIDTTVDTKDDIMVITVVVDARDAKRPEGYPFTVAQVADAVVSCAKAMTPIRPEDEEVVQIKVVSK